MPIRSLLENPMTDSQDFRILYAFSAVRNQLTVSIFRIMHTDLILRCATFKGHLPYCNNRSGRCRTDIRVHV